MTLEQLEELEKKAQPGAFSTFDMEVFVPEVQKLKAGEIYLEIGTDKGKSLSIAEMVIGQNINIYTVDINLTDELKGYLKDNPDIEFFWMSSKTASRVWRERGMPKIYLLFIDGDHSYLGCRNDIEDWYPYMSEAGVMLFHDGDTSSPGVVQAVAEFVDTHRNIKEWTMHKRTDKNTSMMTVRL